MPEFPLPILLPPGRMYILSPEKVILSVMKELCFYDRPLEGQEKTCPRVDVWGGADVQFFMVSLCCVDVFHGS